MPLPFNSYLRGWLGLLDAKVGGRAPDSYNESVQPTLDSYPFLFAQRRETLVDTTAAFGVVTGYQPFPNLVVPSDQIWLCEHIGCDMGTALLAAETMMFCPAFRSRAGGVLRVVHLANQSFLNTAGFKPHSRNIAPFILAPGDDLGAYVDFNATAAAILTISCGLSMIRVQI